MLGIFIFCLFGLVECHIMFREVILWNKCVHWGLSLLCGWVLYPWACIVYDGILKRSLLVFFTALGILSTQSTLYVDSYGSIDLIYQVWIWKLYLILANITLVITTNISFLSPSSIENLCVLMLEVLCWQGRQLDVLCQFLMFRLYIALLPSKHHFSAFKAFASQTLY